MITSDLVYIGSQQLTRYTAMHEWSRGRVRYALFTSCVHDSSAVCGDQHGETAPYATPALHSRLRREIVVIEPYNPTH